LRKQVLILAGGLGTRLRPLTEKCPKPMVPVLGEPFLHWQMMDLKEQGYTDIVLLVSYLGEQVQKHFGDGSAWGLSLTYVFENSPMGTGGAIRHAISTLQDDLEDEFIILNGDSFLRAPLDDLAGFFDEARFEAVVTTYDNVIPTPVPNNLKVKNQIVIAYEKGAGREVGFECVDSGIYIVKKSVFLSNEVENLQIPFQLEDVLRSMISKRSYGAFPVASRFYDIGTPERLREFEVFVAAEVAAGRLHGREPEGVL
jgi:NDP-sugar pyrophosphorylase family protein